MRLILLARADFPIYSNAMTIVAFTEAALEWISRFDGFLLWFWQKGNECLSSWISTDGISAFSAGMLSLLIPVGLALFSSDIAKPMSIDRQIILLKIIQPRYFLLSTLCLLVSALLWNASIKPLLFMMFITGLYIYIQILIRSYRWMAEPSINGNGSRTQLRKEHLTNLDLSTSISKETWKITWLEVTEQKSNDRIIPLQEIIDAYLSCLHTYEKDAEPCPLPSVIYQLFPYLQHLLQDVYSYEKLAHFTFSYLEYGSHNPTPQYRSAIENLSTQLIESAKKTRWDPPPSKFLFEAIIDQLQNSEYSRDFFFKVRARSMVRECESFAETMSLLSGFPQHWKIDGELSTTPLIREIQKRWVHAIANAHSTIIEKYPRQRAEEIMQGVFYCVFQNVDSKSLWQLFELTSEIKHKINENVCIPEEQLPTESPKNVLIDKPLETHLYESSLQPEQQSAAAIMREVFKPFADHAFVERILQATAGCGDFAELNALLEYMNKIGKNTPFEQNGCWDDDDEENYPM